MWLWCYYAQINTVAHSTFSWQTFGRAKPCIKPHKAHYCDRSGDSLLIVHNWCATAQTSLPTNVKAELTLRPKKGECADFSNFFKTNPGFYLTRWFLPAGTALVEFQASLLITSEPAKHKNSQLCFDPGATRICYCRPCSLVGDKLLKFNCWYG